MTDKKKPDPKPQTGTGAAKGQSVRPSSEPESAAQRKEEPVKEIPIGVPVSPEEFRRRKAEAEQASGEQPAVQEIPLGVPVSSEEYRRLKARAERASQAQQDAPADEDEAP